MQIADQCAAAAGERLSAAEIVPAASSPDCARQRTNLVITGNGDGRRREGRNAQKGPPGWMEGLIISSNAHAAQVNREA